MIHIEKEEGEIMKVKKLAVVLLVAALGVWGAAVYDINTRLPIRKIEKDRLYRLGAKTPVWLLVLFTALAYGFAQILNK